MGYLNYYLDGVRQNKKLADNLSAPEFPEIPRDQTAVKSYKKEYNSSLKQLEDKSLEKEEIIRLFDYLRQLLAKIESYTDEEIRSGFKTD